MREERSESVTTGSEVGWSTVMLRAVKMLPV